MFKLLSYQKYSPVSNKKNSFMIGDQKTDLEFAKKAVIKGYPFDQENLYNFIDRIFDI